MSTTRATGIVLIVLGAMIVLSLFVTFVVQANRPLWGGLLLGGSLIAVGIIGIIVNNWKTTHAGTSSSAASSPSTSTTMPQATSESSSVASASSAAQPAISFSSGMFSLPMPLWMLLGSIACLLLCNLGVALYPLLTIHETYVVACQDVLAYTENDWQVIATYTDLGGEDADTALKSYCILERSRFILARQKPVSEEDAIMEMLQSSPTPTVWADPAATPVLDPVVATMTPEPGMEPAQLSTSVPTPSVPPVQVTDTLFPTRTPLPSPTLTITPTPVIPTASVPAMEPAQPNASSLTPMPSPPFPQSTGGPSPDRPPVLSPMPPPLTSTPYPGNEAALINSG